MSLYCEATSLFIHITNIQLFYEFLIFLIFKYDPLYIKLLTRVLCNNYLL